jgi:hypothetical protein
MVMRSRATEGRSASKCEGKWPDQLLTHRFRLSTLRQRFVPPPALPERRKPQNSHWFGGSYGESRLRGSLAVDAASAFLMAGGFRHGDRAQR